MFILIWPVFHFYSRRPSCLLLTRLMKVKVQESDIFVDRQTSCNRSEMIEEIECKVYVYFIIQSHIALWLPLLTRLHGRTSTVCSWSMNSWKLWGHLKRISSFEFKCTSWLLINKALHGRYSCFFTYKTCECLGFRKLMFLFFS